MNESVTSKTYLRLTNFVFVCILLLLLQVFASFSQAADPHYNQITIRNDRVFMLNGSPYFPIGVCFELGENAYRSELKKPNGNGKYGFNFINLFAQNSNLFYCFNSKNMISGDLFSGPQFDSVLNVYWDPNVTVQGNYDRIASYLDDGVYLLSDNLAFMPDDVSHWVWGNPAPCADNIFLSPSFNQQARNESIDRINRLALFSNSRVFGFYSVDDANLFQGQGPNSPMYYYNNFRERRFANLKNTYDYAKSVYPNSMVLMSLPPTFFPRVFDYGNWQDVNVARNAWVNDAIEYSKGANVLFSPGSITQESYSPSFSIYDTNFPKWFPKHIKETLIDRVLLAATEPKAVLGGVIFDVWQNNPLWNDPKMNDKVKWEIYVGLEKGATGLIFFGWHKKDTDYIDQGTGQRAYYRPIWNTIRQQVDTLVNIRHLDIVFTKTNFGQMGFNLSFADSTKDVSYTVYKTDNSSWSDYYLLATNNPKGSLFVTDEGNNNMRFTSNIHSFDNYTVTEVFSGNHPQMANQNSFDYSLPWFGTAMFHITNKKNGVNIADDFYLNQNYPNPFNPVTQISYGLHTGAFVTIEIYNSLGQKIKTLVNEEKSTGDYLVAFDGTDYSSGLYFYRMRAGGFEKSRKMLLIK